MKYRAVLYSESDNKQLEEGLNTMLQIAKKIMKRQKKDNGAARQLKDGDPDVQGNALAWEYRKWITEVVSSKLMQFF